ncbi:MAG: hypothetical protein ACD_22C00256G0021 [uncultured bacterium]|uniref:Uncharacterized protein n=1 Tax=candidate division WWE3 bacterium RBG_16_37_10 TaxID=1802610 RepID=A0A1F4UXR4_UNCKA|nr:MAG: hypothetical protein ACD_22C00256G0021 [uncultured bacterium]OGC49721.1 MAG: hypothetical protein A2W32_05250 [candidate division WWE3 bacterium RBG_16_37_10]
MDESIQTETPHYNLESLEIDWTQVKPKEEEKGKWSFEVSDRQTGRKVGYEFAKALGVLFVCQDDLEDPKPAEDVRMDGNQISFSEYDAELEHAGDVKVVEIYMRYYADDKEYYGKFKSAMDMLVKRIRDSKT